MKLLQTVSVLSAGVGVASCLSVGNWAAALWALAAGIYAVAEWERHR